MRKGIDIISQDPILVDQFKQLEDLNKRLDEKMKFLKKQADAVAKDDCQNRKTIWLQIQQHLQDKGKLSKHYDSDKEAICFDPDTGLVYLKDIQEMDPKGMFLEALRSLIH